MNALKAKGPHRRKETWEELVNSQWGGAQPVLSPDESVKAALRIYRHALGKPFKGTTKITSGRRYTWIRRGVLSVNPDMIQRDGRGLRAMIHDLSHYAHSRLHPNDAPHSKRQAVLEAKLVRYAIRSGFADGRLAPKPKAERPAPEPKPRPDKVQVKFAAICKREAKWASELERAKRLHAKAVSERKVYERRHGARVTECVS